MPCYVKLEILPRTMNAILPRIYKCYFCHVTQKTYPTLYTHMLKKHTDKIFFICDYVACLNLFFDTEEEKKTHTMEQHSSSKSVWAEDFTVRLLQQGTLFETRDVCPSKYPVKVFSWKLRQVLQEQSRPSSALRGTASAGRRYKKVHLLRQDVLNHEMLQRTHYEHTPKYQSQVQLWKMRYFLKMRIRPAATRGRSAQEEKKRKKVCLL
jgi:hypothetical protein